jgi:hypothetical protein
MFDQIFLVARLYNSIQTAFASMSSSFSLSNYVHSILPSLQAVNETQMYEEYTTTTQPASTSFRLLKLDVG